MKIVGINTVNYGSTGKIMINTLKLAEKSGHEVYAAFRKYGCNAKADTYNSILINFDNKIYSMDSVLQYLSGHIDCLSYTSTRIFLNKLNKIKPDVIHIHNLHGRYINIKMLFRWIKKHNVKVIWTFHDCWAFTGKCPHFDLINCKKWQTECSHCPQYKQYPATFIDRTKYLYKIKKKHFSSIKNLTIVTPSAWLASFVNQSFFKTSDIRVINNGIDLNVFKPTENDIRNQLDINDKTVLLGCANPWNYKKGLDVFIKLAEVLGETFKIILVGLSPEQIADLPQNIIGIGRTSSSAELAKYYSMADIFINPTREDTFPTVNIEALACGTPVITFNSGGSAEIIDDSCGISVNRDDITALISAIQHFDSKTFTKENCLKRSKLYDMYKNFEEYVKLYSEENNEFKSFK